jgi:hypothetical protein
VVIARNATDYAVGTRMPSPTGEAHEHAPARSRDSRQEMIKAPPVGAGDSDVVPVSPG